MHYRPKRQLLRSFAGNWLCYSSRTFALFRFLRTSTNLRERFFFPTFFFFTALCIKCHAPFNISSLEESDANDKPRLAHSATFAYAIEALTGGTPHIPQRIATSEECPDRRRLHLPAGSSASIGQVDFFFFFFTAAIVYERWVSKRRGLTQLCLF